MDSRERTFLAIDHQQGDRIPIDFWASRGFREKLKATLGVSMAEFLDANEVDLRYIDGPEYIGPPLAAPEEDLEVDIWGVTRKTVVLDLNGWSEYYQEVDRSPLADASSAEEALAYAQWPSPDWFRYDVVEAQCERIHEAGRVAVFQGDRLNRVAQLKPAMYLRGVEQILTDLAIEPSLAEAVIGRIREFYLAYLERILDAAGGKIDIVLTGDDFGSQNGPLVSPTMWRQFLRQGFAAYLDLAGSCGARTMHHTCGSVVEIIPDMIDCGLQVLQSIQPEAHAMAPDGLKSHFGDRLAFHGGVSIQQTMPFKGPEDIDAEVASLAETLGRGGGYIFGTAHNVQADVSVENVQALMRAYLRHGSYE